MATSIASTEIRDTVLTQLLAVAAVLTAFPAVTLSGASAQRFKTAWQAKITTPANAQIIDEQGDLLLVAFLTASPYYLVYTQKGLARKERESNEPTF